MCVWRGGEFKTYFEGRSQKISPGEKTRITEGNSILGQNNNNWMLLYYTSRGVYMCNHLIFSKHYQKHSLLSIFGWKTEI